MTHNSGEFVYYKTADPVADPAIGIVLRTATNHHQDGTTQDWVEVIGPLAMNLVKAEDVTEFNATPTVDPKEVVDTSVSDVKGLTAAKKTS